MLCRLAGLALAFCVGVLLQLLVCLCAQPLCLYASGPCNVCSWLQGCILWDNWWPMLTGVESCLALPLATLLQCLWTSVLPVSVCTLLMLPAPNLPYSCSLHVCPGPHALPVFWLCEHIILQHLWQQQCSS